MLNNEIKTGTIVYAYSRGEKSNPDRIDEGFLVAVEKNYEGTEDLSYHGSPWYEEFIEGIIVSEGDRKGERVTLGNQSYRWTDPVGLIKYYYKNLVEIRKLTPYI